MLATFEDDSRPLAELLLITASVASLVGVAFGIVKAHQSEAALDALLTVASVVTVILSWAVVHTVSGCATRTSTTHRPSAGSTKNGRIRTRLSRLRVHRIHRGDDVPGLRHRHQRPARSDTRCCATHSCRICSAR